MMMTSINSLETLKDAISVTLQRTGGALRKSEQAAGSRQQGTDTAQRNKMAVPISTTTKFKVDLDQCNQNKKAT